MNKLRRAVSTLLIAALTVALMPVLTAAAGWGEPGNLDINITNGGRMLSDGENFYYSEGGVYLRSGSVSTLLCQDDAANLNLSGGYLYYSLGTDVRRLPKNGGESELVYSGDEEISRMYTIGENELRFVSGGRAYSHNLSSGETVSRSSLEGIVNLIPTEYGDIYLTGGLFSYNVYAGDSPVLGGVTSAYTDSGYFIVSIGAVSYQAPIKALFDGFDAGRDLTEFNLHGSVSADELLHSGGEDCCEDCADSSAVYTFGVGLFAADGIHVDAESYGAYTPDISIGQENIVKRARQLHEVEWTPLLNRHQWGYRGIFEAGVTYTGVPYGQAVSKGYIGWNISINDFLAAVEDNRSVFYTDYSWYNKIAPYYATDCSGFVSYAWQTEERRTTHSMGVDAEYVSDQSIYSLQVGDCMNESSHVVLVSDLWYNDAGELISVEIMEQTPPITKLTRYGEGGTRSLSDLHSSYLGRGYVIYRSDGRDEVDFSHSCASPIGDYCLNCKDLAPYALTARNMDGSRTVELGHKDDYAQIYYTTDGSDPYENGEIYGAPITFYEETHIRAAASTSNFEESRILEYTVDFQPAEKPTIRAVSGMLMETVVSSGTELALASETEHSTVYYTLDGSDPSTESNVYTTPIRIDGDVTIKAIATAPGVNKSGIATFDVTVGRTFKITATAGEGGSISPTGELEVLESTSQTFTITAGPGYSIAGVEVDGEPMGLQTSYTVKNISKDYTIHATFMDKLGQTPFTDIPSGAWYTRAVTYSYANGLFSGTGGSSFSPELAMSRAMFVTVLGRMSGQAIDEGEGTVRGVVVATDVNIRSEPNTECEVVAVANLGDVVQVLGSVDGWYSIKKAGTQGFIREDFINVGVMPFTDVPSMQYYSAYVDWAYMTGMVNGTSATTFAPDMDISREQMCTILYNYAQKTGKEIPVLYKLDGFTDDAEISDFARTAVYAMQQAGIVQGTETGSFLPKASAGRAQVAQIFMNFIETVG